jgi:hypothetical protein
MCITEPLKPASETYLPSIAGRMADLVRMLHPIFCWTISIISRDWGRLPKSYGLCARFEQTCADFGSLEPGFLR